MSWLEPQTYVVSFSGAGILVVADNVGMWWFNRSGRVLTIQDVTMWRQLSGTAGTTIADVEVDPTGTGAAFVTIYAAPNRPSILFGTSPDLDQANTFASPTVAIGAAVRVNLDQIESNGPQNVCVQITLVG